MEEVLDKQILAYMTREKKYLVRILQDLSAQKYFNKEYKHLYSVVKDYYTTYQEIITPEVAEDFIEQKFQDTTKALYYRSILEELSSFECNESDLPWHIKQAKNRYGGILLESALKGTSDTPGLIDILRQEKDNPIKAWEIIKKAGLELEQSLSEDHTKRVAIRDAAPDMRELYLKKESGEEDPYGLLTGFSELDEATKGLHGGEVLVIGGRHGSGKCCTASTQIRDNVTGQLSSIADIVKDEEYEYSISSIRKDKKVINNRITAKHINGQKEFLQITLANGVELECTKNHPVLTFNGWKHAEDILDEDWIAYRKNIEEPLKTKMLPESELFFLAGMIAEGCCTFPISKSPISFTNFDEDILKVFSDSSLQLPNTRLKKMKQGYNIGYYDRNAKNGAIELLKEKNLWGKYSYEKTLPNEIFSLNQKQLAQFIGYLWSMDGSLWISKRCASYGCASKKLVQQLQHLLLRFGIQSTCRSRENKGRGCSEITITSKENLKRFLDYIGRYIVGKKRNLVLQYYEEFDTILPRNAQGDYLFPASIWKVIERDKPNNITWKQLIGRKYYGDNKTARTNNVSHTRLSKINEILRSSDITEELNADITWIPIRSIKVGGFADVYDLSVDVSCLEGEEPNYIANDVVVHNSVVSLVMGKNIYKGVGKQSNKNVLLFSLEMPAEQYRDRFMSSYCQLPLDDIELGTLTDSQKAVYFKKLEEIEQKENWFYIIDTPLASALTVEGEMYSLVSKFRPDVIIIDYLGIMKPNESQKSDHEGQARVIEEVRSVARRYSVPVITAVQLNRDTKSKGTARFSRSDNIGATVDVGVQIEDTETDELSDFMHLLVIKNRKGQGGQTIKLFKDFAKMQILDVPKQQQMDPFGMDSV